jgi:sulfide:quinone oxidoreductase
MPRYRPTILIAGAGVAGLEALIALRHHLGGTVHIELLDPARAFAYRPMAVAEPFDQGDVHGLDLSAIADELGATLMLGTLASVDPDFAVARTAAGGELEYEALLVATGATPASAVPGAFTFRGPADTAAFGELLRELESGDVQRVAFAVPGTVVWPLPLYELALQTAARAPGKVVLVTPEEEPLGLFGSDVSTTVAALLAGRGVEVIAGAYPSSFEDGLLKLKPEGAIAADRVVALPRLEGPSIAGLPRDSNGFIPTDGNGRVPVASDVYAAGDATTFPVKQGGLATQQADAAAEAIAALADAPVKPKPFRPVLRGLILTGDRPLFARADLAKAGPRFEASTEALWWPPGKIVGKYLAPFLADHLGLGSELSQHARAGAVEVEVELDREPASTV